MFYSQELNGTFRLKNNAIYQLESIHFSTKSQAW